MPVFSEEKRKKEQFQYLKSLLLFSLLFRHVLYLEYFTILFIATKAELNIVLILDSRWFLEGDQIYGYEICAWLFLPCPPPPYTLQLSPTPSSLYCWKHFMSPHTSYEGKDPFLRPLAQFLSHLDSFLS